MTKKTTEISSSNNMDNTSALPSHIFFSDIRNEMQRVMQNNAAVFRTGPVLQEGVELIDKVAKSLREDIKVTDRTMIWNTDLVET